jgi:hypothetical protein
MQAHVGRQGTMQPLRWLDCAEVHLSTISSMEQLTFGAPSIWLLMTTPIALNRARP